MANTAQVVQFSKAKQARIIDDLGALKAEIKALQEKYDENIAVFKDFGHDGVFEGKVFKLSVSTVTAVKLDAKKVKGFLTPQQIIDSSVDSTSVRAVLTLK